MVAQTALSVVVSRDLARAVTAGEIAPTLQRALESWARGFRPTLNRLYQAALTLAGSPELFAFDPAAAMAPLPRAYQWCDGSAFLSHARLWKGPSISNAPPTPRRIPLIYQGGSDDFLAPADDVPYAGRGLRHRFRGRIRR